MQFLFHLENKLVNKNATTFCTHQHMYNKLQFDCIHVPIGWMYFMADLCDVSTTQRY